MRRKWEGFGPAHGNQQFKDVLKHLRQCNAPHVVPCPDQDCAEFVEIMKLRFGLGDFPCKHTAHGEHWDTGGFPLVNQPALIQGVDEHQTEVIWIAAALPDPFLHRHQPPEDATTEPDGPSIGTWEDATTLAGDSEAPFDATHFQQLPLEKWERCDKLTAYEITDGIARIREARHAGTVDKRGLAVDVWKDLTDRTARAGPETAREVIAAACKAHWWAWATRETGDRPIAPHGWSTQPQD
jgi:hypothetical protein